MLHWIGANLSTILISIFLIAIVILPDPPEAARALLLRRQLCPLRCTVP